MSNLKNNRLERFKLQIRNTFRDASEQAIDSLVHFYELGYEQGRIDGLTQAHKKESEPIQEHDPRERLL